MANTANMAAPAAAGPNEAAGAAIDAYLAAGPPPSLSAATRGRCAACDASCRWYCAKCVRWTDTGEAAPPRVALPFALDVVLRDAPGASTGVHAALLAEAATLRVFPDDLDDASWDPATTFVLFPQAGAKSVRALSAAHGAALRVVVLDAKWSNVGAVLAHPAVAKLQCCQLAEPPPLSRFWRYHNEREGCLSTIEAVYCAAREVGGGGGDDGDDDGLLDLLWLFRALRQVIADTNGSRRAPRTPSGLGEPWSEARKAFARERRRQK